MLYQVTETNLADQHQSTSEATVPHYSRPMGTAREALSGSDPFMQRGAMHVERINRHTALNIRNDSSTVSCFINWWIGEPIPV